MRRAIRFLAIAAAAAATFLTATASAGAQSLSATGFATNPGNNDVTLFDTASRAVVGTLLTGMFPIGVEVGADGRYAYVVNESGNSIAVIDVGARMVVTTIPVGMGPRAIALTPDARKAYVVNVGGSSLSIIDLTSNTVIDTRFVPNTPRALAMSQDGTRLYIGANSNDISVLDTASDLFLTPLIVPDRPQRLVASHSLNRLYALTDDGSVRVVPLDGSPATVFHLAAPGAISDLIVAPDERVHLLDSSASELRTLSSTGTLLNQLSVPPTPMSLGLSSDGRELYVISNDPQGAVTVVDLVTPSLSVITGPFGTLTRSLASSKFIGPLELRSGTLSAASDAELAQAGFISFLPFRGGHLTASGNWTTARGFVLHEPADVTTSGHLTLAADTQGASQLTKRGTGTLTIAGTATHAATLVAEGRLEVTHTHQPPILASGGELAGTGSVGNVTFTSGRLLPGGDSTGTLTADAVSLSAASSLVIQLNGAAAGQFDRLASTSLRPNSAALDVSASFTPLPGHTFTIADNIVPGTTFLNLPEGSLLMAGSVPLRISYAGGDGNDLVLTVDGPPSITGLSPRIVDEDSGPLAVPFTVGDDFTDANTLIVTAASSNEVLVPAASLQVTGSGANRAIELTPAPDAHGETTITVSVSDGASTTPASFLVTVNSINDAPTIASIAPRTVPHNVALAPVAFTIGDVDSDPATLSVSATSSDQTLVSDAQLTIAGSGANRTVAATPTADRHGETTITITVSDGVDSATTSFVLTVQAPDPPDPRTYVLAEGATGPFFETDIVIANPNAEPADVTLTFLRDDGVVVVETRTLLAMSRVTIGAKEVAGLESASFSTIVTSVHGLPLAVERTMRWDARGYGAHTEKASDGAAPAWYFAEGAQGFFSTFLLLANPDAQPNVAHVTYFREGEPAIERSYPLEPRSRLTVDASLDAALVARSFGARVTFERPGMAERAMYFGGDPIWTGGHAAAGATAPSTQWFFAEGATGGYFTTFLLLANPNPVPATVTLTYFPDSGEPPVTLANILLGAGERMTRNLALEDPRLAAGSIAARVESTLPIVAERTQYWGGASGWIESHNSLGVTAPGLRWALAEGRTGGADGAQTFVLLANPGDTPAAVTLTFLRTSGETIMKSVEVEPRRRVTIAVAGAGSDVPQLVDESFGTLIESTAPIVVERSLYTNADGTTWAAGTNATATALPLPR